jgi:hypothetical protein
MTKNMLLLVATFAFAPHLLAGQCEATVDGSVIDESGAPVTGAVVTFQEQKQLRGHVPVIQRETDSSGSFHFTIELAGPGKVRAMAKKEEEGYPNTLFAFYVEHEPELLDLACGSYRSGIIIQLGPKVGHIGKITVTDADTGQPIRTASIALRRVIPNIPRLASIDVLVMKSATVPDIDVPSGVDISYEISAPGYTTSPRKILHLRPLETIYLSEQLRPSIPAATQ